MNDIEAAINRIRAFAAQNGLSASGLALRAGLSANALRGFHHPDWSPRLATLRLIDAIIPKEFQAPANALQEATAQDQAA